MDRDSIIREWFYRLPNGYANAPYTNEELDVLHEILKEEGLNGSVFVNEVDQLDQAFLDAKPVEKNKEKKHTIEEGSDWLVEQLLNEIDLHPDIYRAAELENKSIEFDDFISHLPAGEPQIAAMKFINSLDKKTLQEKFFRGLHEVKDIPTATFKLPPGFDTDLWEIDAKGIGKGELWGAWKYKGGQIQGGKMSYDLAIGDIKYEVKDYSGKKAKEGRSELENKDAIRVGVEGSVSKYAFWNQILETVNKLKKVDKVPGVWRKLPGGAEGDESADWIKLCGEAKGKTLSLKDYIIDRVDKKIKVVTGEFNKTDTKKFVEFYETMNRVLDEIAATDINQISARGPNQKPVSIVIEPVPLEKFPETGEFTINITNRTGGATSTSVINFFKELTYVRNPDQFLEDINGAVADIITKGEADYWMVFRGKKSDIRAKIVPKARASEFQFSSISQNGIKFLEPGD